MRLLQTLWMDDGGFIISLELVFLATICVIGLVVGWSCIRNQVVQELVDVGSAIGNLSQTYVFGGVEGAAGHSCGFTDGGMFIDLLDFCQGVGYAPPAGLRIYDQQWAGWGATYGERTGWGATWTGYGASYRPGASCAEPCCPTATEF